MKFLKAAVPLLVAFGLALLPATAPADEQAAEQQAVAAAKKWLALVDQDRYTESWTQAAAYFKAAVTETQWVQSMDAFRKPLGKLIKRELASYHFTKSLPGAPDGEYVVIQFKTSFQNNKSAVETVTPMLGKDGKWRVSGYYIK